MIDNKKFDSKSLIDLAVLAILSASIRILLIPAYFSTDFNVHQNWLRITTTLPIKEWYFNNESKWTLDYPPLFAYFEYLLGKLSLLISPKISESINSFNETIYFQRLTVIASDIPYLIVLYLVVGKVNLKLVISYLSISFIILDNIHFQYNIIMQAFLLLSVYLIATKKYLLGAFIFSFLLNFKHIYLYCSLAFFTYLLKNYVLSQNSTKQKLVSLIKLATATLVPFLISFLPFLWVGGIGQIQQIFSRLFPFQRGLVHDYWAPNFWAIYYFIDKLSFTLTKLLKLKLVSFHQNGLDLHQLKILPKISPLLTTLIVVIVSLPILIKVFKARVHFVKLVFLCGVIFFMFGFHVHEKAITPYLSLLLLFTTNRGERHSYNYINSAIFVNIISLLPLLIDPNQKLLKLTFVSFWIIIWHCKYQIKNILEGLVIVIGVTVVIFHEIIHPFLKSQNVQFLPLMINSVFSATFNLSWLCYLYFRFLSEQDDNHDKQIEMIGLE